MGHIQKRDSKNKPWRARWTDPNTGKERSKSFTRKGHAEDWLRRVEAAEASGIPIDAPKSETVGAWLDRWLETVASRQRSGTYAPRTAERYILTVRRHLIPRLGHHPLRSLAPSDVERFCDDLIAAGYSPSTVVGYRAVLSRALNDAERDELIDRNPVERTDPPRIEPGEPSSFTPSELDAIIVACDGHRLGRLFLFGMVTGMRASELRGLRWDDVDLDAQTYTVRQTRHTVTAAVSDLIPTGPVVSRAKTSGSGKATPLSTVAVRLLTAHKKAQAAERLAAPYWSDRGLVFTTGNGGPLDHRNLRRDWKTILRHAEVPDVGPDGKGRGPHELRRTFATRLRDQGVPLEDVQRLGRWTSPTVLLRSYAGVPDVRLRAAADHAAHGLSISDG